MVFQQVKYEALISTRMSKNFLDARNLTKITEIIKSTIYTLIQQLLECSHYLEQALALVPYVEKISRDGASHSTPVQIAGLQRKRDWHGEVISLSVPTAIASIPISPKDERVA